MTRRNHLRNILSVCLAILLTVSCMMPAFAAQQEDVLTGFAEQFQSPEGTAKPYIRWWASPANMTEEEARREVRLMAEGGFGGIEWCELSGNTLGTEKFAQAMVWVLDEAIKCGIQIDFNISTAATIVFPDKGKNDKDYEHGEQGLYYTTVDFTASEGAMNYTADQIPMPKEIPYNGSFMGFIPLSLQRGFEHNRPYTFVAVTAAKKNADGSYDADSVVDITASVTDLDVNDVTGASIAWEAPEAGEWTLFYHYQQAIAIECVIAMMGLDYTKVVADHLSTDAALAMMGYWDRMIEYRPELAELLRKNGGSFFGDSLEIGGNIVAGTKGTSAMWTGELLEQFEADHGYDLTPYLPVIFKDNYYPYYGHDVKTDDPYNFDFGEAGLQVVDDYYQTLTNLFANNHVATIRKWAEDHGMTLRYQVYGQVFDLTQSALQASIIENETLAAKDKLDSYRLLSGAVHMSGRNLYSTESAAVSGLGWSQTWAGSTGSVDDKGLLYYYNRQLATGVNLAIMHGFSYRTGAWPGDSTMNGNGFSNEWDDKTPMWENIHEITDYLARTQFVMQKGQADIDLAVYRSYTYDGNSDNNVTLDGDLNAIEMAGYTYDFAAPSLLRMDNAVVGEEDGKIVLAADGPSYKALILDQRKFTGKGGGLIASAMPMDTAEAILGYAEAGLPIVIVGNAPDRLSGSYAGSTEGLAEDEAKLAEIMAAIAEFDTTVTVATKNDVPAALEALGVQPDAQRDDASALLNFHRFDGEADYYYLYNSDLNNAIEQTVALKGEGTPYLLNAWSGEIIPIAQYKVEDGSIVLNIELQPDSNMLIAIAGDGWNDVQPANHVTETNADAVVYDADGNLAARVSETDTYTFVFDNGTESTFLLNGAPEAFQLDNWTMTLESWTGGASTLDTVKTQMGPFELNELVPWIDIEGLGKVAGVATYTTTFDLEEGWDEGVGATISFDYVSDALMLKVNGSYVAVDQQALAADIGEYLVKGENTIEVKVTSNLANTKGGKSQRFGIVGDVTITPYRETVILAGDVVLNLAGEAAVTVDQTELTYTVSAENADKLATITLTFGVEGLNAPVVDGLNGWYVIAQSEENGVVSAVLGNNDGVTGEAAIAALTGTTNGKVGTVTVSLTNAVASSYVGDSEAFNNVLLTAASVETEITYSVYDVNQDGTVNQLDITRAQRYFCTDDPICNVDGEGDVGISDLVLILNNYSK